MAAGLACGPLRRLTSKFFHKVQIVLVYIKCWNFSVLGYDVLILCSTSLLSVFYHRRCGQAGKRREAN